MRPRRYVSSHWLDLLGPALRYSYSRHAFVLRGVGRSVGPVLRHDRRLKRERPLDGIDRRRPRVA